MKQLNVLVQGLGFVGAAMSTVIASKYDKNKKPLFNVLGLDLANPIGQERVNKINRGYFPFKTKDQKLMSELKKAFKVGNLRATTEKSAIKSADVIIVSINCDLISIDGIKKINIDHLKNSLTDLAKNIKEGALVIIESTVPPGTCDYIAIPIFKDYFKKRKLNFENFYLAHSYERVMPGKQYFNSISNYWRVYAGFNERSADKCEKFLSKIINIKEYPLTRLKNTIASETGKVLENSYRAVNIAFMEEWGRFAEQAGIDLFEVIESIRYRPTHSNIRQPGFGVGGYCLTKDPLFAKISSRDILKIDKQEFPFSSMAIEVNKKMPLVSLDKIKNILNNDLIKKKILVMGVSYRQDIGDTRYSPSEIFVKAAIDDGAFVEFYDPLVKYWDELNMNSLKELPKFKNYEVVIFTVPHKEFSSINFRSISKKKNTLFFDANNVLTNKQIEEIKKRNLNFYSIGRG